MRIRPFYIFLLLFAFIFSAHSFAQQTEKEPRILFLVDASGSMNLPWLEKTNRFQAAREIIIELMEATQLESNNISFGVRVFGADFPAEQENCFDTQLEVPFRYQNLNQIKLRMNDIYPKGFSPIAYSLEKAAKEDFTQNDKYDYSLILITDGGESCDGDICAIMETILSKKISFKPYIISLINDGPLADLYHCLGDYSVVENRQDITKVVQRIISENEDILKIPTTNVRKENRPPIRTPVEVVEEPRVVTPEIIVEEDPVFVVTEETPEPIREVTPTTTSRTTPTIRKAPFYLKLKKSPLVKAQPNIIAFQKPLPKKLEIEEEAPARTVITMNPERPTQLPKVKEREPLKQVAPITEFHTTANEDAEKTVVEVYFTNSQGKYFWTEPRVRVANAGGGAEVMSFNRHVSGNQPKQIEIQPGVYDFTVPNSSSSAPSVRIEANKVNKVYIKVARGSLAFYHPQDPKVAVSQYEALVSKRFDRNSPVVKHRCDLELPYDPANYHIEINTLPPLIYNLDIDFTSIKLVAIPQPGFIEITNENRVGMVEFYYLRGDRYVSFHKMMITGNPEEQVLEFLPGRYQVHYFTGPQHAGQKPNVVPFTINGKETTSIHLSR